jgi:hypothetical protein
MSNDQMSRGGAGGIEGKRVAACDETDPSHMAPTLSRVRFFAQPPPPPPAQRGVLNVHFHDLPI